MADTTKRRAQSTYGRPPARVYQIVIALLLWLAVPWWIFLGTTVEGAVAFAVCVLFSLVAFGLAAACTLQALRSRRGQRGTAAAPDDEIAGERRLRTASGPLRMRAATVQILLVPAAVTLGFTALAVVDVIVRS